RGLRLRTLLRNLDRELFEVTWLQRVAIVVGVIQFTTATASASSPRGARVARAATTVAGTPAAARRALAARRRGWPRFRDGRLRLRRRLDRVLVHFRFDDDALHAAEESTLLGQDGVTQLV